jgi:hypothetical protein
MIQPLRTMHRRAFLALAFLLPLVIGAGLAARRPRLTQGSVVDLPTSAYVVRKSGALWSKHVMPTVFYADSNGPADIDVVVKPSEELNEPDLLLYWTQERPAGDSLPSSARLIGPFIAGKSFVLSLNVDRVGYLVLFSLPHQTVFDTAKVERLP